VSGQCCGANTLSVDAPALLSYADGVLAKVHSCAIVGLEAAIVEVEVDTARRRRTGGSARGLLCRVHRGASQARRARACRGLGRLPALAALCPPWRQTTREVVPKTLVRMGLKKVATKMGEGDFRITVSTLVKAQEVIERLKKDL
jgi:hypothetical protein